MSPEEQKQQFSFAFVRAVASVAGIAVTQPSIDDDSIDLTLSMRGGPGPIISPRLEAQVKCTARRDVPAVDFGFSLKIKNYDDLRQPHVATPRVLFVVLVPDDVPNWVSIAPSEMLVRYTGFWVSLRGNPDSGNATSKTITISVAQQLTPNALTQLMNAIAAGNPP